MHSFTILYTEKMQKMLLIFSDKITILYFYKFYPVKMEIFYGFTWFLKRIESFILTAAVWNLNVCVESNKNT